MPAGIDSRCSLRMIDPVPPSFMRKRKKDDLDMPSSWRNLKKLCFGSRLVICKSLEVSGNSAEFFSFGFLYSSHFMVEYASSHSAAHGPLAQNDCRAPSMPVDRIILNPMECYPKNGFLVGWDL